MATKAPLLAREDEECDTQGSLRLLANPGRFLVRLEPPGDQREEGESQRRGIFSDGIADQNVRCRRAGHLKEESCIGPFPESRESRPEQRTNCEDLPDSDNVQDESWIADGADVLYDIGKVREVHESPHQDLQDENGSACNVDDPSIHSRFPSCTPGFGFSRYYENGGRLVTRF
jgi:hypothetical protein